MTGRWNTLRCVTTSSGSPHFAATSERVTPSTTSLVPQRIVSAQAEDVASRPTSKMVTLRFMGFTIGPISLTGNERHPRVGRLLRKVRRTFCPLRGTHAHGTAGALEGAAAEPGP